MSRIDKEYQLFNSMENILRYENELIVLKIASIPYRPLAMECLEILGQKQKHPSEVVIAYRETIKEIYNEGKIENANDEILELAKYIYDEVIYEVKQKHKLLTHEDPSIFYILNYTSWDHNPRSYRSTPS